MSLITKYAFRACTQTPTAEGQINVSGPCYFCRGPHTVTVNAADLAAFKAGGYAQQCFPYLSADDREFLISGICGECWKKSFAEDEDE